VPVLQTSTLVPDLVFVVLALAYLVLGVIWPAIDAARQRRWLWVAAIVVFSPFAGIVWWIIRFTGRTDAG
jgi:Na+/melibiose symporter-like transporter